MIDRSALNRQLDRSEAHIRAERWRGYDPYDALCSPLFRLPVLRSNHLLRFGAQQFVKRVPFNVRPLLRVPKGLNPVTVALYAQGLAYRSAAEGHAEAETCVAMLADLQSRGYCGACWGYPFDWEARHASIPAGTPTVVATGMVTNALAVVHQTFGIAAARELVVDAARFVLEDLPRVHDRGDELCWAYSPLDSTQVLNATLKGSRLLAQAVQLGAPEGLEDARRSARFVVARQRPDGAWPYAVGDERQWVDSFHTGYVLECLREYAALAGDDMDEPLERGFAYYRQHLFDSQMTPKYYDNALYPIDATACAQALITLCTFGDAGAAGVVAERSIELLARPDGSFAYQRRRRRTVRIPYLRWSTAWMYCGLARLSLETV